VEAETFQAACDQCFWPIVDCDGKIKTPRGGWANVNTGEIVEEVPPQEVEEAAAPMKVLAELTDMPEPEKTAWHNRLHIMQLAQTAQSTFLKMGALMYKAQEAGEWTILHYESFREYIDDLGLPMSNSYSWATRLIGIYEFLAVKMGIPEKILIEIGVAKLTRLLPAAREDRLTMEMLEQAKALSDLDLRETLGHNVGGGGDTKPDIIVCPRCGESFNQRTATRAK